MGSFVYFFNLFFSIGRVQNLESQLDSASSSRGGVIGGGGGDEETRRTLQATKMQLNQANDRVESLEKELKKVKDQFDAADTQLTTMRGRKKKKKKKKKKGMACKNTLTSIYFLIIRLFLQSFLFYRPCSKLGVPIGFCIFLTWRCYWRRWWRRRNKKNTSSH